MRALINIRPNSVLAIRCGLLAKWLRVSRLGLGLGPGNAQAVLFFCCGIISVVNIFIFGGSVSLRWTTYEYLIDDVTATWIEVNLVSP